MSELHERLGALSRVWNDTRKVIERERNLAIWLDVKLDASCVEHILWVASVHPRLQLRTRPAVSEGGIECTEYMLGSKHALDKYVELHRWARNGLIGSYPYQVLVGDLLGYPREESEPFARKNVRGRVCACSQCIPKTAYLEEK